MKKIPVIIDCDPGVDDSYAISLAASRPEFDIVAITPVEGNVAAEITRKNALCLSEILGIDCRVAFGAEKPLEKPYIRDASGTHGKTGVGDIVFRRPRKEPDRKPAWDVIYEEAVKAHGELVLFAIGPLTNIAIALGKHPDLPGLIDKFCIMGGGTFGNVGEGKKAEFNIWIDPLAAKEVFEKMEVYMVGLNATHAAALTSRDFDEMISICKERKKAWLMRELSEFSKRNSEENGSDNNIIHDALAVASLAEPGIVTFKDYYVYVEADPARENEGETVIDYAGESGKAPNCHVAVEVDQPRFARLMKDVCRFYRNK